MDLKLHFAINAALNAAQQMSGAAWSTKMSSVDGRDMTGDYVEQARKYLADASSQLNAYDAKRTYKPEAAT